MAATRLVDLVFPGDTNHHGTLFGGAGLALMDRVAFIAASRHGGVDFVTASAERIDFTAPAGMGEIVELTGRVTRCGRRSLSVEVVLEAEVLLTGERRLCSRGVFNLVAVGVDKDYALPPLAPDEEAPAGMGLRMVEIVFPDQTSHYGSLFGGHALAAMAKAAFVAATRHRRRRMVLASTSRVDFKSQIRAGEILETTARVIRDGTRSLTVGLALTAEPLRGGARRPAATGEFVMVELS